MKNAKLYASVGLVVVGALLSYCYLTSLKVEAITSEQLEMYNQIELILEDISEAHLTLKELSAKTDTLSEECMNKIEEAKIEVAEKVLREIKETEQQEQSQEISIASARSSAEPNYKEVKAICTFYTSLASENGGYAGRTANNGYLSSTSIAAPKDIPFGTKIDLGQFGTKIVDDRGSSAHIRWIDSNTIRLDVYVPQNKGETAQAYYERVNELGKVEVSAKIYID